MFTYVITGARGGIGLEYVRALSKSPSHRVVALVRSLNTDISELKAIEYNSFGQVHIAECDIASPSSIALLPTRLEAALGADFQINTLINNAAILHSREQTALTMSPEALQSHVSSNVVGPALMLQALLPYLTTGAKVANITSGIASLNLVSDGTITAEITPYSISKTALNMLTVHQAWNLKNDEKWRDKGVTVVCIDPGHAKTEMGGPKAVVKPKDSAEGVLEVLEDLQLEDSGKFYLFGGKRLPW
jgi:NAD(P)-dependent dehydrogenase (short-subunit alcohol dehydrogenase family)